MDFYKDILTEDDGVIYSSQDNAKIATTCCHLEVTLKHPYDKVWTAKTSVLQKAWYRKAWHDLVNTAGTDKVKESGFVFEFHESGHVHLHGYIKLQITGKFSPIGLIADYAKVYYMQLSKKHNYNEHYMFPQYLRYAAPATCVQYYNDIETPDRIKYWVGEYMLKCNDNIEK